MKAKLAHSRSAECQTVVSVTTHDSFFISSLPRLKQIFTPKTIANEMKRIETKRRIEKIQHKDDWTWHISSFNEESNTIAHGTPFDILHNLLQFIISQNASIRIIAQKLCSDYVRSNWKKVEDNGSAGSLILKSMSYLDDFSWKRQKIWASLHLKKHVAWWRTDSNWIRDEKKSSKCGFPRTLCDMKANVHFWPWWQIDTKWDGEETTITNWARVC